jgi:hypothetical protein
MGWSATRNANGTLHVVSDVDGSHFEAANEDEVHEVLASIEQREQDRVAAEQQAANAADGGVTLPEQTLRTN